MIACTHNGASEGRGDKRSTEEVLRKNNEERFDKWLAKHGLTRKSFTDTSNLKIYHDIEVNVNKEDSTPIGYPFKWYPSQDTSYYFLTNYDTVTGLIIGKVKHVVYYRFYDVTRGTANLGTFAKIGNSTPLGFFWLDNKTFYDLEKHTDNAYILLTKWVMDVDSVWVYSTKDLGVD